MGSKHYISDINALHVREYIILIMLQRNQELFSNGLAGNDS